MERRRDLPGESAASDAVQRVGRLTAAELRLLSLATTGGLTHAEIGQLLGTSRANVANSLQRVRRKLAAPNRTELQRFIATDESLRDELARKLADPKEERAVERRSFHLVRATVDELSAVAVRARHRADTVARGVDDVTGDTHRATELALLRTLIQVVEDALESAVARVRSPAQSTGVQASDERRQPQPA